MGKRVGKCFDSRRRRRSSVPRSHLRPRRSFPVRERRAPVRAACERLLRGASASLPGDAAAVRAVRDTPRALRSPPPPLGAAMRGSAAALSRGRRASALPPASPWTALGVAVRGHHGPCAGQARRGWLSRGGCGAASGPCHRPKFLGIAATGRGAQSSRCCAGR